MSIKEKIFAIIADQLNIEASAITLEAHPTDDLGGDSLDLLEIALAVEKEFNIDLPEEHENATVGQLIAEVEKQLADKQGN